MKVKLLLLSAVLLAASLAGGCGEKNEDKKESSSSAAVISKEESTADVSTAEESKAEESKAEESSEVSAEVSADVSEPVDPSWFDDAVFIGDSVTLKLSYYCDDHDDLGNAQFLCAGSLGYNNAQWDYDKPDNVHPVYNGTKYLVDDGAAAIGAKKIFIMLGMNDIGLYGVDGAVDGMKIITERIEKACPDAVIYIQSVTPMLEGSQLTDLNNTTIAEFNEKVKPICQERGYKYLDVASAMDDGSGNLVYEYCGDPDAMGLHFSDEGCKVWADYLKANVLKV